MFLGRRLRLSRWRPCFLYYMTVSRKSTRSPTSDTCVVAYFPQNTTLVLTNRRKALEILR